MTQVNLQLADGTVRNAPLDVGVFNITGATSPLVVTMSNISKIQLVKSVVIVSTANVRRAPSGAVTISGSNGVSVTDGSFANGEKMIIEAIGYAS